MSAKKIEEEKTFNKNTEKASHAIEEALGCINEYRSFKKASGKLRRALLNLKEIDKLVGS